MGDRTEVVVVGGGPAGLTAAIALAGAGVETMLIAPPAEADHRTTALLTGSVTALATLGAWQACRPHAAPLRVMRIVDDTDRLLRAPEARFDAAEIGLEAFGYNIENRLLLAALAARARELPKLACMGEEAAAIAIAPERVTVRCASGASVSAQLAIAADGRRSICRAAAGIEMTARSYPQAALTCNLRHARAHADTSTELHTESGPFTLVPLPGRRSSLVCVVHPAALPHLSALDDEELAAEIESRSHSILGRLEVEPGRGVFPLAVETARCFGKQRVALVGEAAHVIPPIGAQGLNLGLRDAATIGELVVSARKAGGDAGADAVTARYERMRRADVTSRTIAVDLLNRTLLSDFLPLQGMRGLGLFLLQRLGPLRRAVMREGLMPAASEPALMRGDAL